MCLVVTGISVSKLPASSLAQRHAISCSCACLRSSGWALYQVLLPATRSAALAKGRESWLYFTVPETPVAGAPVVVYFNRSQSEPLM